MGIQKQRYDVLEGLLVSWDCLRVIIESLDTNLISTIMFDTF